jgi:hypothetical protein
MRVRDICYEDAYVCNARNGRPFAGIGRLGGAEEDERQHQHRRSEADYSMLTHLGPPGPACGR